MRDVVHTVPKFVKRNTIRGASILLKLIKKREAKANAKSEKSVRRIKNEVDMAESCASSFAASHDVRSRISGKATSDDFIETGVHYTVTELYSTREQTSLKKEVHSKFR
jgi:hypothetical protein